MRNFGDSLPEAAIRPGHADYESARRVFNADVDCRPRMVVRCGDAQAVAECVNYARKEGLPVAVRGGGHSIPGFGTCEDGIVIDLSPMKTVEVDAERRIARVGGGCTWSDFDHAAHAYGLATTGGLISTTGVGGLTLGGGFGYLSRRYGLTCDNLISAEIVTADGRTVTASAGENPDLFWGIRGGGGNFGVAVSFEFRLHPVREVYAGPILYPLERAEEVLCLFRSFMKSAPRAVNAFFAFMIVPPGPPFPPALHGKTVCAIMCACDAGAVQAQSLLQPLLEFGPPLLALPHPMPYPILQSIFDGLVPHGLHHYWKADFARELTGEAIAAHVRFGPGIPTVNSAVHIYALDGAVHDVGEQETAFAYRDVKFVHVIAASTPEAADLPGFSEWVREYWAALHPHSAGGAYVNFLMDEGEERVRASYRGNYERLAALKREYDPENLFRLNQNIRPAEG